MGKMIVEEKTYAFALRIIKAYKHLVEDQKEFVLAKQLLRSGTSIGALCREAEHAQSRADFVNKLSIALKEANETEYWLMLLRDSGYISNEAFDSIIVDSRELIKLLISIVKTTKNNSESKL